MEEDGFVLVKRRNRKKQFNPRLRHEFVESLDVHLKTDDAIVSASDLDKTRNRILSHKSEILAHPVWTAISDNLSIINKGSAISEIVCYGLGSVLSGTSIFASRIQLGLLLALSDSFSVHTTAYDPAFTDQDIELLKSFGINVFSANNNAKHLAVTRTLYFMPRCPFELFNNILWKNWFNLTNVVLVGNDLTFLDTQLPTTQFKSRFLFIYKALHLWKSYNLDAVGSPLDNVMNNSSIYYFNCTNDDSISPQELAALEPSYA